MASRSGKLILMSRGYGGLLNQLRDEDPSPQKGIFLTADSKTTYKFHKYMIKQTKIFVKQITKSFSFLI